MKRRWWKEEQVQKLVKAVVHCDFAQDPPIDRDYDKLYDVVISSLAMEVVAKNYDEYKLFMCRLGKLVKPGGLLLLYGVENNKSYIVGDFTFRDFPVSSEMATTTMKNASFDHVSVDKFSYTLMTGEYKTYMFIKGTRIQ